MQTFWRSLVAITMGIAGVSRLVTASGAEFRAGDEVLIKADETISGDLYAFGKRVTVDGTVEGDLVAFGQDIIVNGTVKGHVMAASQTVLVAGTTGGVRVAGQVL